jgi:hypothetical protein
LKLAVLVAQYFYQHRELNLPGIGTFYLDDAVTVPDMNDKNFRDFLQYIQFKQRPVTKPDTALIDFIRQQTGKIKPLAESDLESYVADGKLLLNIGKLYHIEGIGTLNKNKEGIFEFVPGEPMLQRLEAITHDKDHDRHAKKSVLSENSNTAGSSSRKLLILAGVLIGLAIIVWGGYTLYSKKVDPTSAVNENTNTLVLDTVGMAQRTADSLLRAKEASDKLAADINAPKRYKYVLETCRYATAMKRKEDLKSIINIETKDSVLYKIVMYLPGTPSDTLRIKDSLHNWYWGDRPRKITIEQ